MSSLEKWKQYWRVVREASHDGWLELDDPEGKFNAGVRYDGCVNLRKRWPGEDRSGDQYIHLCYDDLERLRILAEMAKVYWEESDRWNAWSDDD